MESRTLKILGQAAGLIAGIGSLVYLTGGAVLALRFEFERLPSTVVVGQIPREFVISTGWTQVLLPALIVGALYATYRLLRGADAQTPKLPRLSEGGWRDRARLVALALIAALALIVPGVVNSLRADGSSDDPLYFGIGFAVASLLALILFNLRARIASGDPGTWNKLGPAVEMSFLYVFAAAAAFVYFAATFPLLEAKICGTEKGLNPGGVLIGETTDKVFLGQDEGDRRRVIVEPYGHVRQLHIGAGAETIRCPRPVTPPAPTSPEQDAEAK